MYFTTEEKHLVQFSMSRVSKLAGSLVSIAKRFGDFKSNPVGHTHRYLQVQHTAVHTYNLTLLSKQVNVPK